MGEPKISLLSTVLVLCFIVCTKSTIFALFTNINNKNHQRQNRFRCLLRTALPLSADVELSKDSYVDSDAECDNIQHGSTYVLR